MKILYDITTPSQATVAKYPGYSARIQWDNASPHTAKAFEQWVDAEFAKRGWTRANQPSQSPETNVLDRAIFPALSKHCSKENFDPVARKMRMLRGDSLATAVMKVWDELDPNKIARAFQSLASAGNKGCVFDIIADKGSNEYMQKKGANHYGIRKRYLSFPNGIRLDPGAQESDDITLPREDEEVP